MLGRHDLGGQDFIDLRIAEHSLVSLEERFIERSHWHASFVRVHGGCDHSYWCRTAPGSVDGNENEQNVEELSWHRVSFPKNPPSCLYKCGKGPRSSGFGGNIPRNF